jgi:alpha-tubulin suppressor-like RCC1 family protein
MAIISQERKGTWNLDDVYKRIGADCWRYSAIDSGDTLLYYMGRGIEGQFANNDAGLIDGYPRQIKGNDWGSLCNAATYRAIVIQKCDGTAWAWGNNDYGKLGDGGQGFRSTPIQIDGCWCMLSGGYQTVAGIKCDGSYWNWGFGNHGQLGLFCASPSFPYSNQNFSVMTRVGLTTDWCYAHAGYHTNYGIKTNNTAWSWGYNAHGELGSTTATTNCTSSPIQIVGTWTEIRGTYPTVGKRSDGSYWIWGHNNHGQLGNNSTVNQSSPIALPGTWIHLSSDKGNASQMMAGIKNDNTLWTWGLNNNGQLGQCNTIPRSSPIQIPGSWKYVATGHRHTVAIKTDGTLWGWGHNSEQRYQCSGIDFSSPIQLAGSCWLDIGSSYDGNYIRKCGIPITQE